jgi:putative molybdopterin biosynthesis protein
MAGSDDQGRETMDTHQVARYLCVKERKIYELVKDKRIPCVRVTGKWLFPKAEIDEWLRRRGEPAAAASARMPMVIAGSHDPLLDWCLRRLDGELAVLPGTSTDGLLRMAAGEAALAGVHLLDGDSGEFNIPQVRAALAGRNVALVEWAWREQGLVVAPGNPLALAGVGGLVAAKARVVLRQPGAGARNLFEWLLARGGVALADLTVAEPAARSETEVGLAVAEGAADAGLAVASVARSLRLDFVPLHRERFDLVIDRRAWFEPPLQRLFAFARSEEFTAKAASFGGYDVSGLGMVRWNA